MLILLIFIAIPIIEITLFIQVGGTIGLYPTLGIVILTAIIGSTLLKSQGLTALGTLQNSIKSGRRGRGGKTCAIMRQVGAGASYTPQCHRRPPHRTGNRTALSLHCW